MGVLGFLFLISFIIFTIFLYLYINFNSKGIFKIVFNDEKYFKIPLEPFNYFFISALPIVFWRELLNSKRNINFKRLYQKEFYYKINKKQLDRLFLEYPLFFYLQYLIFLSSFLFFIFGGLSYLFELKNT